MLVFASCKLDPDVPQKFDHLIDQMLRVANRDAHIGKIPTTACA